MTRLVLFAPNVNTGGGLTLLQALLASERARALRAFLDARATAALQLPEGARVTWVEPKPADRLRAERLLSTESGEYDTVLCFHGLPPLLGNRGRVVVFQQNRLLVGRESLGAYPLRTRMRLSLERLHARILRRRVATYVVQTPSMRRALVSWHGGEPDVRVCPYVGQTDLAEAGMCAAGRRWDFLYVADGVAHKNHLRLLEAWRLLAEEGLRPTLALTLGERDRALVDLVEAAIRRDGLNIENVGALPHAAMLRAYHEAGALVFPSTAESFGLPLIEAERSGLPVVASERDFVRDVCVPAQTFDPDSAVSIARAVKRFLGCDEPGVALQTPERFLDEVLAQQ